MSEKRMSAAQGYSITTYRFRLRCGHPEWLTRTRELYDGIMKFYYDILLSHEELWEMNSQETLRSLEYLSLPGKEKRRPQTPLPWEDVPPYFRRAAVNAGIAAARSFLARRNSFRGEMPAREFHAPAVYYSRMYRDFSSDHITLRVWDGETWRWMGCRLSGRDFPPGAGILSPSVTEDGSFFMLHVPVREPVEDTSPVRERLREGGNVCGLQFTNGDAFAVASICGPDGKETAVRFFNGGLEYSHRCGRILEKIHHSMDSLGNSPEGPANRKYWMHLKHLREYYAHQVSREIIRFCGEHGASVIVLPRYRDEYTWKVMKGAGNWNPLHLSIRIRSYLRYKAWKDGIIVVETHAEGTGTVCAKCGQPLTEADGKTKEYVCRMGHRGNRYLNTARNLAVKCRRQFQEQDSE